MTFLPLDLADDELADALAGIEVIFHLAAQPAPASAYGVTKLAAEQRVLSYARDEGVPACSLRLFSVIGPRERPEKLYTRLIGCILEDREFPLHDGSQSHLRSYTYVGDVVDGLVAAMVNLDRCAGEIFNIGYDLATTTAEGIRTVEQLLGKSARIVIKPRRPGDQARTHAKIGKARRILDYNPAVPLEAGLARQIEWYERHMLGKINLW
ncbi:MAG: NAD-dependent epimerase/dehydratase family protein [Betaproteobacteria bacterium]|nr:NAD-dependent epimerase/dehydratase family protein [Betaproteobacteria bacterium]